MSQATLSKSNVPLAQIIARADFVYRRSLDLDQGQIKQLRQHILNVGRPLDPLLLWKDAEKGRLVILDGRHRVAAYQAAKWRQKVPVLVLEGDRRAALLAALGANARTALPLSNPERMDAAWRLVREPVEPIYKVREIAEQSGVSIRTIKRMRQRWHELRRRPGELELSGSWNRDRSDDVEESFEAPTEAQIEAQKRQLTAEIRDSLDWRKRGKELPILRDSQAVGEAVAIALGAQKVRAMLEYWYGGEDEWAAENEEIDPDAHSILTDDPPELWGAYEDEDDEDTSF